jgi:thiamine pyrophosphate-dependent acetolactate synthase large subunit-like protein
MIRFGSDAIVDLLEAAGIDRVALNPGATFRGIQDSIVQREDGPELALCMHESVAVTVAQGYAKAAGRPMAALLHNVVGLQNASMAIYNAWCDRAPMVLIGGTGPKSKDLRRPWIDWIHTANSQGEIVRNYTKWDDEPSDMASVPESFARALTATVSEPTGPVYLCYDISLQEDELPDISLDLSLAGYATPTTPAPEPAALERMLAILDGARSPLILVGHCGTEAADMEALGRLAESLGAPVLDTGVRLALPTEHPLNATGCADLLAEADVVLALDVDDIALQLGKRFGDEDLTVLAAGLGSLRLGGWSHDYQTLSPAAVQVTASTAETVAGLLRLVEPGEKQRRWFEKLAPRIAAARAERRAAAAAATAEGTVPVQRLVHEVGEALADQPFVLANGTNQRFELAQWTLDQPRQYLGWHGGGGLGYGVGATIGAALAQPEGTIAVDIQADGDLLFLPSALWTAAHLGVGALIVVNDNRQYGNTVEHAAKIAKARGRDTGRRYRGAGLADPPVDIPSMARSYGVWAAESVTDPQELPDTLAEAIAVAASGRPALVDVITPGF